MISKRIQSKGILAKILEKSINILIRKECKNIGELRIDIIASSIQIIKGIIQKINIKAKEINYKDLLFDELELEANEIKIIFKINNNEINFKNNFIIKLKISLSEYSLKTILLSSSWSWISDIISKEILNQDKLEDIEISNNQIFMKTKKDNERINAREKVEVKAEKGNLYLLNKAYNKSIRIPLEDKVEVKKVSMQNDLINILVDSYISFS